MWCERTPERGLAAEPVKVATWSLMPVYAAMLRAVNVAGKNKVAMAELRGVFEGLGHTGVTTYVQSGNVVFGARSRDEQRLRRAIEAAIAEHFGIDIVVMLRAADELRAVVRENPFQGDDDDATHLVVMFCDAAPDAATVRGTDGAMHSPDRFAVVGREIYLHCPNGLGRSKLTNDFFERKLGVRTTGRNWRTINKLVELTE